MKKLYAFIATLFLFTNLFAQVEYEHVGSLYDFWQPTKFRVYGDYAYVAINTNDEINIYNIGDPNNITFVKKWKTGQRHTTSLEVYDNYLYTQKGDSQLRIFDLTDPATPALVNEMYGLFFNTGEQNLFADQYLYQYNFMIWDFSAPTNPVKIFDQSPYLDEYGSPKPAKFMDYIYFTSWHYVMGTPTYTTYVLNVSDPSAPVNLGEYDQVAHSLNLHSNTLQEDSLNYDGGKGWSGQDWFSHVTIRNFADPFSPVELGDISWDFPNGENSTIYGKVGNYLFVKDELNDDIERLHSINVVEPTNPSLENTYEIQASSASYNGSSGEKSA